MSVVSPFLPHFLMCIILCVLTDFSSISKFLNRILGMKVAVQNALFTYFTETLTSIILDAKRSGRWDMGIMGKFVLWGTSLSASAITLSSVVQHHQYLTNLS